MKYELGLKFLVSFIVGGVAILYKLRVTPKLLSSDVSALVKVPSGFLFDFLTKPSNVPAYFSWITKFEEIDKRKNLTIEKSYRGTLNLPFLGQHELRYYISDFEEGKWVVLKPDRIRGSYFDSEIVLMVSSVSKSETQFYMKIIYHRYSARALFQMTLGPVLKSLTDTQLEKVARRVQAIAVSRWRKRMNLKSPKRKETGNGTTETASRVVIKSESEATPYWTPHELESRKTKSEKPMAPAGVPVGVPINA